MVFIVHTVYLVRLRNELNRWTDEHSSPQVFSKYLLLFCLSLISVYSERVIHNYSLLLLTCSVSVCNVIYIETKYFTTANCKDEILCHMMLIILNRQISRAFRSEYILSEE